MKEATAPDIPIAALQQPPPLGPSHALFLDFDGTLADIAPAPDRVVLAPETIPLLAALRRQLQGALAVITGRPVEQIDALLPRLPLVVAGEHGATIRRAPGRQESIDIPDLRAITAALDAYARAHAGLLLEHKPHGVALHYRGAPALEADCLALAERLCQTKPGLALLRGKAVVELKPAQADKGRALRALMQSPPFAGRTPVFLGDDATDEAAIEAAQALGGMGIKVGQGASAARHRLAGPGQVLAYLSRARDGMAAQEI